MKLKFLIDMNLTPRWVEVLMRVGIEAAHWSTLGLINAP
jgi:predicted nuclease of predicted toxin-antitoxin system